LKALEIKKLVYGEHNSHVDLAKEKLLSISSRQREDEEEQKSKTFFGFIGQALEGWFGDGKKADKQKKNKEKEENKHISHHGQDKIPKSVPIKGGHGMVSHALDQQNQEGDDDENE